MEINIEDWRDFEVGKLFKATTKTAKNNNYKKSKEPEGDYIIPALSSKASDNSFGFYVKEEDHNLINELCLSVTSNGNAGKVFVQNKPFAITQDAYALKLKDYDADLFVYFFLAAMLEEKLINKYGFNEKATWNKVKKEKISLPATYNYNKKEYEPDFKCMKEFIKYFKDSNKEKLYFLNRVKELDNSMNINNWHEFELIKLFDIKQSKGDIQFQKCSDGNIPLVSSGNDMTNSIVGYIAEGDGIAEKFESGNITIDMFGSANYQNSEFYAVSHGRISILKPLYSKNNFVSLFIVSCLNKKFKSLCSYNNMCSMTLLKKESILLPAIYNYKKNEYEPDFKYMEEFIEELVFENKKRLELLNILYKIKDDELCGDNFTFDTSNWYEFKLKNIFNDIKKGKIISKKDVALGEIPLVSYGRKNNGISCYVKKNNALDVLFTEECITIDIYGNVFFRDYPFYADDNVIVLKNDKIDIFQMLYLTSVISKIIEKYKYQDKLNFNFIDKIKIPLPPLYNFKKRKYEPDWEHMTYIIRMMCDLTKFRLRSLKND